MLVAEGLRVDIGGGYTQAELAEDAPGVGARKGARLPGAPKMSANLAIQYDFTLRGRNAFVRADSFYTGKFYGNLLESPLTVSGDYMKVDARAGLAFQNLSAELFVRNLTDEDAFTWRGLTNSNASYGYRMRPRTVGVELRYSFD
jgi:iron complex outermembrane receptor protein